MREIAIHHGPRSHIIAYFISEAALMDDTELHLLHRPPTSRRFFFQVNHSLDWHRLLPLRIVYVGVSIAVGCTGLVWFLRLSSEVP